MNNNHHKRSTMLFVSGLVGILIYCCCLPMYASSSTFTRAARQIQAPHLRRNVLELALKAYENAKLNGYGESKYISIVDFSLPSVMPRLWVINLETNKVEYHTYVAHGIGSGLEIASKFSDRHGSGMSSLGLYQTGDLYRGKYGVSLNLHGLESGFNGNAHNRRIVMHPAHYVSNDVIRKIGRLGRSLGCLALDRKIANKVMHKIKGGSYIFCYYPDHTWLQHSKFL